MKILKAVLTVLFLISSISFAQTTGGTTSGSGGNLADTSFANPTGSVKLTATNGSSVKALRSDGAPAIDQSIAPTWTGMHKWKNRIYIDSSNGFQDRGAMFTVQRLDTLKHASTQAISYYDGYFRGDSGLTFSGAVGQYIRMIEDTTNNGGNGRKRGVGLGLVVDLVGYTPNEPYTVNRDITGILLSVQGTVEATEAIYIGGSRSIPHTSANPYGYAWGNGITIEDTLAGAIKIAGENNLGIDLSPRSRIGNQAYAIKTALTDTSIFGSLGVGVNPPVGSNASTSGTLIHIQSTSASAIPELKIENTATGGNADFNMYGKTGSTVMRFRIATNGDPAWQIGAASNHQLELYTNNTPRLWIAAGGNTSIGSLTTTSLFNVGSAAQFQINSSGVHVAINGITVPPTEHWQYAPYADTVQKTNCTATLGATNLNNTATNGVYRISVYLYPTTAGTSGTVTATVRWNDGAAESAVTGTHTFGALGTPVFINGQICAVTNSTAITYETTVSSPIGSPVYTVVVVAQRLF